MLLIASFLVHDRVMEIIGGRNLNAVLLLSPRELDCLKYCAAGLRDNQIAKSLGISQPVVSAYMDSARHKLGASTRPNAVARAIKFNLISADIG